MWRDYEYEYDYCWNEYANRDTRYGPAPTSSTFESENVRRTRQHGKTHAAWPYDTSGPPKHVPITQVLSTNRLPSWATQNHPSYCSKPAPDEKLRSLLAPIQLPQPAQIPQVHQAPMTTRFGSWGMPATDVSGRRIPLLSDPMDFNRNNHHHSLIPTFRTPFSQKPREPMLSIPYAGGDMVAKPIKRKNNINDDDLGKENKFSFFSEPRSTKNIKLKIEPSAIKCIVSWTFPCLPRKFKYKQLIEVDDNLSVVDRKELAPHITSYRFKTTPGQKYNIKLIIVDQEEKCVAKGKCECKAVFSLEEINRLMEKALTLVTTTPMQPFTFLYRCKPRMYWDHLRDFRNGMIEKYIKDNNGHSASPINGQIYGLFFYARTMADGSLPPTSPFGGIRFRLNAPILLDPNRVNMYFCDFYCYHIAHYVTLVVCNKDSQTDLFCHDWLKRLDMENNPFLRVQRTGDQRNPFNFWVNKVVWVEIYYTEDISITWGAFDTVTPTGAGMSKIGGISHNRSCLECNLYPSGPQPDNQKDPEIVEDLIASYEKALSSNGSLKKSSTHYILHSCVESELHSPSTQLPTTISKDFLELSEVITQIVDNVVNDQGWISKPQQNFDTNSKNCYCYCTDSEDCYCL